MPAILPTPPLNTGFISGHSYYYELLRLTRHFYQLTLITHSIRVPHWLRALPLLSANRVHAKPRRAIATKYRRRYSSSGVVAQHAAVPEHLTYMKPRRDTVSRRIYHLASVRLRHLSPRNSRAATSIYTRFRDDAQSRTLRLISAQGITSFS
jgi:hypothetical protein